MFVPRLNPNSFGCMFSSLKLKWKVVLFIDFITWTLVSPMKIYVGRILFFQRTSVVFPIYHLCLIRVYFVYSMIHPCLFLLLPRIFFLFLTILSFFTEYNFISVRYTKIISVFHKSFWLNISFGSCTKGQCQVDRLVLSIISMPLNPDDWVACQCFSFYSFSDTSDLLYELLKKSKFSPCNLECDL